MNFRTKKDALSVKIMPHKRQPLFANTGNTAFSINYRFGSLKASVKKTDTSIKNNDLVGGSSKGGGTGAQK